MKRATLTQLNEAAQEGRRLQSNECCSYYYSFKCQLTTGHEGSHEYQHNRQVKRWPTITLTQRQRHILVLVPDEGIRITDLLALLKVNKSELYHDLDMLRVGGMIKGGKPGKRITLSDVGREEVLK